MSYFVTSDSVTALGVNRLMNDEHDLNEDAVNESVVADPFLNQKFILEEEKQKRFKIKKFIFDR